MSREKSDQILKLMVKNFFIQKEVTSTLMMDSLCSGLEALVGQTNGESGKGNAEEQTVPIVSMENDMFVLVDDVLLLLERAVLEPFPPKNEKGPRDHTNVSCIIAILETLCKHVKRLLPSYFYHSLFISGWRRHERGFHSAR